jgi:outer membrane lipoprotein SlyB
VHENHCQTRVPRIRTVTQDGLSGMRIGHGSRVHGFTGSQVHGFTGSQVHGFTGSRVHRFTGSRVHGFTGSQVHGFTGSRVHEKMPAWAKSAGVPPV